jgi:hypothetical protein
MHVVPKGALHGLDMIEAVAACPVLVARKRYALEERVHDVDQLIFQLQVRILVDLGPQISILAAAARVLVATTVKLYEETLQRPTIMRQATHLGCCGRSSITTSIWIAG